MNPKCPTNAAASTPSSFGLEGLENRLMMSALPWGWSKTRAVEDRPAITENWQRSARYQPSPEKDDLVTVGRNRYFILEPGYKLVLEGEEDGEVVRVEITVTNQTKRIDGVRTRVVREVETVDGELVEISQNFMAIDEETKDVFYFGEDVDIYEDGEIVSHDGAWRSGVNGAKFGVLIPAKPRVGMRFFQERAPGVALDEALVVSTTETVVTPAGTFTNCLKIKETTSLEPGSVSIKYHAPGIGLIVDSVTRLISFGKN